MRAIDTNIVVRYLTGDKPEQAARAKAVVEAGQVFVSTTVMLESEWVLRSVFGYSAEQVAAALRAFSGLPEVSVENPAALAEAFDYVGDGMDFADALHLAAAGKCEVMLTFDRRFIERAGSSAVKVREP